MGYEIEPDGTIVVVVPRAPHVDPHLDQSTHVRDVICTPSSSYRIERGTIMEVTYDPRSDRWWAGRNPRRGTS